MFFFVAQFGAFASPMQCFIIAARVHCRTSMLQRIGTLSDFGIVVPQPALHRYCGTLRLLRINQLI